MSDGDADRLQQILLNLLINATKFTEHGEVVLQVAPGQEQACLGVRIDVVDTGPGLSEEQCQRLFRRFEQVNGASTAVRYGGSGLGLAICRELATVMEGEIHVDSELGKGTCFRVLLPSSMGVGGATCGCRYGYGTLTLLQSVALAAD